MQQRTMPVLYIVAWPAATKQEMTGGPLKKRGAIRAIYCCYALCDTYRRVYVRQGLHAHMLARAFNLLSTYQIYIFINFNKIF